VALPCPSPNPDGSFTFTVRINSANFFWAIGWGVVNAAGVVSENFLSHANMRLTDHGAAARSRPPEPVFGNASVEVYQQSTVPGLLFECTYDPAQGTMRARYPNARTPDLQLSCVLFNNIPVGAPLVPVIRFNSKPVGVGLSLTVITP
jgi:hypothetical protein